MRPQECSRLIIFITLLVCISPALSGYWEWDIGQRLWASGTCSGTTKPIETRLYSERDCTAISDTESVSFPNGRCTGYSANYTINYYNDTTCSNLTSRFSLDSCSKTLTDQKSCCRARQFTCTTYYVLSPGECTDSALNCNGNSPCPRSLAAGASEGIPRSYGTSISPYGRDVYQLSVLSSKVVQDRIGVKVINSSDYQAWALGLAVPHYQTLPSEFLSSPANCTSATPPFSTSVDIIYIVSCLQTSTCLYHYKFVETMHAAAPPTVPAAPIAPGSLSGSKSPTSSALMLYPGSVLGLILSVIMNVVYM